MKISFTFYFTQASETLQTRHWNNLCAWLTISKDYVERVGNDPKSRKLEGIFGLFTTLIPEKMLKEIMYII